MFAFPSMLFPACDKAGIKHPESDDKDLEEYKKDYPHFYVFCKVQLSRRVRWGEQFDNAKVIAALSEEEVLKVTLHELIERGLSYASN